MSLKNRVRRLESARGDKGDKKEMLRNIVRERLNALFHSCPKKLDGWKKFRKLYPGVSKLNDLSTEGVSALKQVFQD